MSRNKKNTAELKVPIAQVIPGEVKSYYIGFDTASGTSVKTKTTSRTIKKSSSQEVSDADINFNYIAPPISPRIANDFYEQNIFQFRAITLKALCVAGIGYTIEPTEKTDEENADYSKDPEYIKLKKFLETPNNNDREDVDEEEIFENIIVNWLTDRYIYGYSFLEIVENKKGELAEIYNLRAHNVFAKVERKVLYYIQRTGIKEVWFKRWNSKKKSDYNGALILKNYHPRSKYYGMPEWLPATPDLITDRSIGEYRIRKFDNNLMIQFIIIVQGGALDTDTLEDIKKFLASNYKGVGNSGKALVLSSDRPEVQIKIEKVEAEIPEIGFIQTRSEVRDFTLAAHGIASILLGAKFKGQLGGTTELKDMLQILNETIVKPEKRTVQNKLNKLFRDKLGVTKFELILKELTIEKFIELVNSIIALKNANVIDENEAREEINYKPRDIQEEDIGEAIKGLYSNIKRLEKRLLEA